MILLIEDKLQRQFKALNSIGLSLDDYAQIIENGVDEKYDKIYQSLKDDSFDFSQYNFIISHKSAFDKDNAILIDKLKEGCSTHNIPLVLFSGGVDAKYFDKDRLCAEMSSMIFYSDNLKLFLEKAKEQKPYIQVLLYGEHWQLNILLNSLEKIDLYIDSHENEKEIFYKRFVVDCDIENLQDFDIDLYKPVCEGKSTSVDEIKKLADSLRDGIKELVDE